MVKNCVTGFDSHYVVVDSYGFPCTTTEAPKADELVVFSNNQILPRYLVYYDSEPLIESISEATQPILLWVDDSPQKSENVQFLKVVVKLNPEVLMKKFTSSAEAITWIKQNKEHVIKLAGGNKLRIMTNRYRKEDGGELAGENFIQWIKDKSIKEFDKNIFIDVPVLMFCGNIQVVQHINQPKKKIFVTTDATKALNFAAFQAFT